MFTIFLCPKFKSLRKIPNKYFLFQINGTMVVKIMFYKPLQFVFHGIHHHHTIQTKDFPRKMKTYNLQDKENVHEANLRQKLLTLL